MRSRIDPETWKDFEHGLHKDISVGTVIFAAQRNRVPYGELDNSYLGNGIPYWYHRYEEAVKLLMELVPKTELLVLKDGEWWECSEDCCETLHPDGIYRLHPAWQGSQ